jgi:hypothetical protein
MHVQDMSNNTIQELTLKLKSSLLFGSQIPLINPSHPIYIALKEGFDCPFISPTQENTTMIHVSLFSIFTTVPNYSPTVLVAP